MSKKLLKCKDFACELTPGLIAMIDEEAVVILYASALNDNLTIVNYMTVQNQIKKIKYMSHMKLVTTYITVDDV